MGLPGATISFTAMDTSALTMLKTAMTRMSAVVVMVSVMRGHGLLAMTPDDRSNHIHEADVLLLQCCGDGHVGGKRVSIHMLMHTRTRMFTHMHAHAHVHARTHRFAHTHTHTR